MNADLQTRLENWAHALRREPRRVGHAQSAEGFWRSPQQWEAPKAGRGLPLDLPDARAVERAWRVLGHPRIRRFSLILEAFYVRGLSPRTVAAIVRRAGYTPVLDWRADLAQAHLLIEAALSLEEHTIEAGVRRIVQRVLDAGMGERVKVAATI